jgi:predicted GNAT family N-acyltransferase
MIKIRLANTAQELTQIARLRYDVYVEVLGATMRHADHQRREVRDSWDATAHNFAAWCDGELVGCVRLNCAPETDLSAYATHCQFDRLLAAMSDKPLRLSAASKLIVRRDERNKTLALRLAQACYEQMHVCRASLNFLTCQTRLIRLYQKLGFQVCGLPFFDEEAELLTPMALVVEDLEYLQRIQSPFFAICQRFPVEQPHANDLRQLLADWQTSPNQAASVLTARAATLELCA